MIAWRVPLPDCLPVVDLPGVAVDAVLRLVGRGGERGVFFSGSVSADGPVLVSSCRLVGVAHVLGVLLR